MFFELLERRQFGPHYLHPLPHEGRPFVNPIQGAPSSFVHHASHSLYKFTNIIMPEVSLGSKSDQQESARQRPSVTLGGSASPPINLNDFLPRSTLNTLEQAASTLEQAAQSLTRSADTIGEVGAGRRESEAAANGPAGVGVIKGGGSGGSWADVDGPGWWSQPGGKKGFPDKGGAGWGQGAKGGGWWDGFGKDNSWYNGDWSFGKAAGGKYFYPPYASRRPPWETRTADHYGVEDPYTWYDPFTDELRRSKPRNEEYGDFKSERDLKPVPSSGTTGGSADRTTQLPASASRGAERPVAANVPTHLRSIPTVGLVSKEEYDKLLPPHPLLNIVEFKICEGSKPHFEECLNGEREICFLDGESGEYFTVAEDDEIWEDMW